VNGTWFTKNSLEWTDYRHCLDKQVVQLFVPVILLHWNFQRFTLLVWRQERRPACKKSAAAVTNKKLSYRLETGRQLCISL